MHGSLILYAKTKYVGQQPKGNELRNKTVFFSLHSEKGQGIFYQKKSQGKGLSWDFFMIFFPRNISKEMNSTKQKLQSINYDFLLQGIDFNNISLKQIS